MSSLTSSASLFPEFNQVMTIISNISQPEHVEQIHDLVSKYQEQPQLIDPYLGDIIGWRSDNGGIVGVVHTGSQPMHHDTKMHVMNDKNQSSIGVSEIFINDLDTYFENRENISLEELKAKTTFSSRIVITLRVLFLFAQVRGFAILKYFPNQFSLFPRIFTLLKDLQHLNSWECECMLWLWLSHLSRNPFPFQSLTQDTNLYLNDIFETTLKYFETASKVKMCAAEFLGRFLNRRDVIASGMLQRFIELAKETLLQETDEGDPKAIFFKISVLKSLVLIMKYTPDRTLILPFVLELFDFVTVNFDKQSTMMKHLHMKFIQRLGLLLLKPIVVSWRYQKSRQSLLANLAKEKVASTQNTTQDPDVEDDIDVPEEIETILDKLIQGLRDSDTIVRWSAAKGVGRITMRLPRDMGDDVVSFVLDLLSDDEEDSAWHGGCLALAELARRGLLLPSRLEDVVPTIMKALQYDIRRGSHSVGAHVRDSACYVCWAFARAYAPDIFESYVFKLSSGLLKTAIFDREVNCRRAASAAFQENVGRQGNFPHGIEILTRADYFTLSNITTSYLEISDFVAQFEEYRIELMNHLVDTKINHWDKSLRILGSKALGKLTHNDPVFVAHTILKKLVPMTIANELEVRHGALLSISEILFNIDYKLIEPTLLSDMLHIIPNIEAKRLYRGKGGEVMREAVCRFIECISQKSIPLPAQLSVLTGLGRSQMKGTRSIFQRAINENLKHPNEEIVEQALRSLKAFSTAYYNTEDWIPRVQDLIISPMIQELNTDSPAIRRGYLLALGSFPKMLILQRYEEYGKLIMDQIPLERNVSERDAESRRNAVRSIISLCETVGGEILSEDFINKIFDSLFVGIRDYSTDNRGDVGLWIREASMNAMMRFVILLSRANKLTKASATQVFQALLKQANEKIDRAREVAGRAIETLLFDELIRGGDYIPHQEIIRNIILDASNQGKTIKSSKDGMYKLDDDTMMESDQETELDFSDTNPKRPFLIDWINPQITFPLLVQLLQFEDYRFSILSGIVVSIGGLTRYIATSSCDSLTKYLKQNSQLVEPISDCILSVLLHYSKDKRVLIPAFKMLTLLISHECFSELQPSKSNFIGRLLEILQNELRGTRDIQKLLTAVPLIMQLIPFEEPARKLAFRLAFGLLGNRFPKVRMYTAEQLVAITQTYAEDIMEEEFIDEVLEILIETAWGESLENERESVDKLRKIFNIEILKQNTEE